MKRKMLLLAWCAAAGVALISFAEVTPGGKSPTSSEVSQMRSELDRLKAKVESLESRTKSLEFTVEQLKQSHSPTPLNSSGPRPFRLNPPSAGSGPPTIWGEGKVNGWTYYIVPCEQESH